MAERTGFEPARLSPSGFQDQCHQPLGHLSTIYYIIFFKNLSIYVIISLYFVP